MATKFRRKRTIFAKLEVTYGVDPVPIGSNAIRTKNLTLDDPYAGDRVSRDLDRDELGLQEEINVNPYVTVSFEVEIAGSGTPGTAPKYGPLLKACRFTEDVNTGDVIYTPHSTTPASVTLHFQMDGQLHKILGARGNVSFNWAKGIPTMKFTFSGLYATPVAAIPLTADFTGFQVPLPVTNNNTTLTVGAYSGPAMSLTCDMGNTVVPRNVMGMEEILITDRGPTGQLVIDMPSLGDIDIFSDFVESHEGVINTGIVELVHGTVSGNIVEFYAPKVQLSTVNEGDDSGIATYSLNARYIPNAGDDDVRLTVL